MKFSMALYGICTIILIIYKIISIYSNHLVNHHNIKYPIQIIFYNRRRYYLSRIIDLISILG